MCVFVTLLICFIIVLIVGGISLVIEIISEFWLLILIATPLCVKYNSKVRQ